MKNGDAADRNGCDTQRPTWIATGFNCNIAICLVELLLTVRLQEGCLLRRHDEGAKRCLALAVVPNVSEVSNRLAPTVADYHFAKEGNYDN